MWGNGRKSHNVNFFGENSNLAQSEKRTKWNRTKWGLPVIFLCVSVKQPVSERVFTPIFVFPYIASANQYLSNDQGLTCLTLACKLGRDELFKDMLELSCKEFWRYSNICCSAYPLGALDSILPDGSTNWGSAMMIILAG